MLADVVHKLTDAYRLIHPDKSSAAIERRITGAFSDAMRSASSWGAETAEKTQAGSS